MTHMYLFQYPTLSANYSLVINEKTKMSMPDQTELIFKKGIVLLHFSFELNLINVSFRVLSHLYRGFLAFIFVCFPRLS